VEGNFKYEEATVLRSCVTIEVNVHKNNTLILNARPSDMAMATRIYIHSPKDVRNIADMLNKAADAMETKPAAQEDDANG
jgi:hypothetical protein